jgi:hypothetical protein
MLPAASGLYFDEEECLGFPVFVAELELLVGNARGKKKAEPRLVFQLLQKLVATLERTGRLEVREYQRRCEDALIDILLKGAPPPVSGGQSGSRRGGGGPAGIGRAALWALDGLALQLP